MSITKSDKNTRTAGRPTLNEVACRAGVSPIAALHALCGVASVAEELVQKIRDTACEFGYVVNPATRTLASARSHGMTVSVPSLASLPFIEILEAIHIALRPQDLEVLIGNFHYLHNEEESLIHNYLVYQPHGLLLTGFERIENTRRIIGVGGVPCVHMMDLDSSVGFNRVDFSQLHAGGAAAEHLPVRDRRRLAYISVQLDQRTLLHGEGLRRVLQKTGYYNSGLEILTPRSSSMTPGDELFVQLLTSQPQINGVFFCDDDLAQGALLEALCRGVKVPEQIAVLGFSDLPGLDYTVPRLSSIRTPYEAIGRHAAEQLLALVAGKEVHDSALDMGFELMARESA